MVWCRILHWYLQGIQTIVTTIERVGRYLRLRLRNQTPLKSDRNSLDVSVERSRDCKTRDMIHRRTSGIAASIRVGDEEPARRVEGYSPFIDAASSPEIIGVLRASFSGNSSIPRAVCRHSGSFRTEVRNAVQALTAAPTAKTSRFATRGVVMGVVDMRLIFLYY